MRPAARRRLDNGPKFPLPGSHPFFLLGKLSIGYFFIGDSARIDRSLADGTLFLRIDDDAPGNGNGAFQVFIQVYRDQ